MPEPAPVGRRPGTFLVTRLDQRTLLSITPAYSLGLGSHYRANISRSWSSPCDLRKHPGRGPRGTSHAEGVDAGQASHRSVSRWILLWRDYCPGSGERCTVPDSRFTSRGHGPRRGHQHVLKRTETWAIAARCDAQDVSFDRVLQ